jgi:hypothetical protein
MPQTPKVSFKFDNKNVQSSVPQLGIVNVVARTTKGPFEDPSDIISNPSQFARIFGSEIVPDGSVSNISKALELGAKLRISRVAGTGASYGWAKPLEVSPADLSERAAPSLTVPDNSAIITILLSDPSGAENSLAMHLAIRTREAGSPVIDNTGNNLNRPFYLKLNYVTEPKLKASIIQYSKKDSETNIPTYDSILDESIFFSATTGVANPSINVDTFQNFLDNAPNITFEAIAGKEGDGEGTMADLATGIQSIEDVVSMLRQFSNWNSIITIGKITSGEVDTDTPGTENIYMECTEGSAGNTPTKEEWMSAYQASKQYYEAYEVILSHVHQHLPSDYTKLYKEVSEDVQNTFENLLYVEVPKYAPSTRTSATPEETLSSLKTMVQTIGAKKEVAYFGGGIKYYNENGALQKCDVLGSVMGLSAVSASIYGPWYSFSGMNRGVITSAMGPVMKNLGSPAEISTLEEFAQWYMNLFVIKDTRTQGKRTMLWHGFTSNPTDNSEKFISIVRLNLYIKKNLRPILESYIEEPNTFDTWKRIYYEGKEIMDNLLNNSAITSYEWLGDQDAQSYDDLQVNTESDVRNGKYKLQIKYKEIVPMQDITTEVIIEASVDMSTGEVSISQSI